MQSIAFNIFLEKKQVKMYKAKTYTRFFMRITFIEHEIEISGFSRICGNFIDNFKRFSYTPLDNIHTIYKKSLRLVLATV